MKPCDDAWSPDTCWSIEDLPMSQHDAPHRLLPIVTLLTPEERLRVDAIGVGYYHAVHHDDVSGVINDLKSRRVHAMLFSVTCTGRQISKVASLVREFSRIPAVALLSEIEAKAPQAVLALGQSGVCRLIDVRHASGWRELRGALMADTGDSGYRSILGQLSVDLAGVPTDCWQFFEALFVSAPRIVTVQQLSHQLNVLPSTLMSRFFRAGIPAPKRYLAMARLVRAARLFENNGFSVANIANHMDYSSPQSFGRHVKTMLGLTASEFRVRYDCLGMFDRFRQDLIFPYEEPLRILRPLTNPVGWTERSRRTEWRGSGLPSRAK
jgi:AraC-like DNA-binding protein